MSGVVHASSRMEDSDQRGQGDTQGSTRNMSNGSGQVSHLQFFGHAKKRINDIFKEIGEYVWDTDKFIDDVESSCLEILPPEVSTAVKGFRDKVQGIREVIQRNHMKVAFFGRTSNGKSTVINAMLRDKIMPSGIGHTTHCFIQVEGSDSTEPFLLTEESEEPKSLGSIKQLAHNLSDQRLKPSSLIRIFWPKDKCRLLREDVVFMDSPGIDVDPDLDSWIDQFCLDADVFVLVANAESTLMQTEKNFFHKVSSRLSKPNIFVLQNRWDVSAQEEEMVEEVRKQHTERNIEFFVNELKVVDKKTAEDRVFFVSAREALISRLHQDKGTPTPSGVLQHGFQIRLFEFASFEDQFEQCISKSAVKTKFEQHTERGKTVTADVRAYMEEAFSRSLEIKGQKEQIRDERASELDFLEKQLMLLTQEVKERIKSIVEEVERKVASALNDEIRRLSVLVEEYDRPFHSDNVTLNLYKKELHAHVEQGLGRNLQTRCSAAVLQGVVSAERNMTERLSSILPEETRQQIVNQLPKKDFEIAYRLDCRNLCADFNEDIDFKFSLGPTNLVRKLLGGTTRSALMGTAGNLGQATASSRGHSDQEEVVASVLTTFVSLSSRTTLGAVVVAGVLTKAAGWRVIAVSAALYGLLYLYERLTWTTKAKERALKQQYVEYASSKLKLIVDLTSSNCSHQVQQELASTFATLCHQADISKQHLEDDLTQMESAISQLREISGRAKSLRNKADWLDGELNSFISSYLKPSSA